MPRVKKPTSEKLIESINTPVTRGLKKLVVEIATERGVSHTKLTRRWIEQCAAKESKQLATVAG